MVGFPQVSLRLHQKQAPGASNDPEEWGIAPMFSRGDRHLFRNRTPAKMAHPEQELHPNGEKHATLLVGGWEAKGNHKTHFRGSFVFNRSVVVPASFSLNSNYPVLVFWGTPLLVVIRSQLARFGITFVTLSRMERDCPQHHDSYQACISLWRLRGKSPRLNGWERGHDIDIELDRANRCGSDTKANALSAQGIGLTVQRKPYILSHGQKLTTWGACGELFFV